MPLRPTQFLFDEHIPPAYPALLRQRKPELTLRSIGDADAPGKGTLDPDLLLWCEANDFLLITNNRKSMPGHLAEHLKSGHHIPGILTVNPLRGLTENIDSVQIVAEAGEMNELRDLILYLPL